ncbi:toprim domain-containing protein [Polaribacter sp. MSW5]|uniref:Toprim domain-containing protein n=1 Tax=Polaribacter ponticola TaxID=2978475 RepID=A0ABT5S4B8_9FLAO|nr:toprim domain-containing protein [Polaribacter sp. MSW5]MDD7912957.1 toprim domain-containing protein [Polaribacter sp. MSW5]
MLTEGYTDVIAMHKNGCKNTVASCGTALTDRHAQLLKKYADEVVLLRDGDEAGLRTMLKKDGDIDICLAHGLKVSICLLPDGEDPDTFSRAQENMQDWINSNKLDAVYYKVSQYDLIRDRYEADVTAMKESYQLLIADELSNKIDLKQLEKDFTVNLVSLKDLDKEAFAKAKESNKTLESVYKDELKEAKATNKEVAKNIATLKAEQTKELKGIQKTDTYKKSFAVTDIANTLFKIKHEINRADYVKQIAKTLKIATTALKAEIGKFEIAAAEEEKAKEKDGTLYSTRNLKLPKGGNMEEYLEHGFLTIGNQFHFPINGQFIEGTDWKFEPLFQIMGDKENKRLAEITNTANQKKIIEFDSEILSSFGEFRRFLFKLNGFLFYTDNGIKTEHFDRFVRRYNRQFQPASELLTMGQNPKNFYAFANGVYWQDKFRPVNKFGIMNLKGIDTSDGEYNEKIDNYYSPAFSVMHKDNQVGDDKYENDRYFVYKESPITLNDWMDKMQLVFDEKGIFGILFNFGALFRDLFITHYSSFPLLGGFGETGSGKSAFGEIIQNFFYYRMAGVDLTQATSSGLSKTLTRTTNTVVFCDEFQDKTIKPDLANLVMGGWNGNGRVKSKDVGSTRTTVEKIMTAIYYCGQFLPTYMDGGLANRTMSLYFQKTEKRTSEEKENFTDLLNVTNEGISSLTSEILQYRAYFSKNLPRTFAESERSLKALLKEEQYDDRVFKNTTMIHTTYMILKEKIKFPFTEETLNKLCANLIIENSEQIRDTSALTEFWSILTFLFESNKIKDHLHFRIDKNTDFKVQGEKRTQFTHKNENNDQILYLRLNAVYQLYNKEATTREGVDVIGISTIRNYLHSTKEFIGLIKGKRFGKAGSPSCYAINYTALKSKGLLNLIEDNSLYEKEKGEAVAAEPQLAAQSANKPQGEEPDDLPF